MRLVALQIVTVLDLIELAFQISQSHNGAGQRRGSPVRLDVDVSKLDQALRCGQDPSLDHAPLRLPMSDSQRAHELRGFIADVDGDLDLPLSGQAVSVSGLLCSA
ncbi:hypothetical protein AEGHOMDF_5074 [Methylobacterium soli]|nr:hypothetical protein AEGHOMDF_5074 [Methylobacterium soli]